MRQQFFHSIIPIHPTVFDAVCLYACQCFHGSVAYIVCVADGLGSWRDKEIFNRDNFDFRVLFHNLVLFAVNDIADRGGSYLLNLVVLVLFEHLCFFGFCHDREGIHPFFLLVSAYFQESVLVDERIPKSLLHQSKAFVLLLELIVDYLLPILCCFFVVRGYLNNFGAAEEYFQHLANFRLDNPESITGNIGG